MPRSLQLKGLVDVNPINGIYRALSRAPARLKDVAKARVESEEEKLMGVTVGAHDLLFSVSSVFPLVLFPDTISMDRQKLTITHRVFFRSSNKISVQIDDILNVESNVGPLFGSIHIYSKYFTNDLKSIGFLPRFSVLKIQKIIQGYIIAHHKGIDCSDIEKVQLLTLLQDLGQDSLSN